MIAAAGQRGEAHVALQHHCLGGIGDADQAEPCRELALVHHAFADEVGVFGVVHDQRVEVARIGQRAPHHLRIGDALVAIGEGDGAGGFEQADLGHLLAAHALGQRRHRVDVDDRGVAGAAQHEVDGAELSMTGEVSGWQMMVVMPPAAAAWLAEAKVSRWLAPGSPTKARMSIRPGATILPAQLMMSVPSGTPAAPMPRLKSRITPSAIRTSPGPSKSL